MSALLFAFALAGQPDPSVLRDEAVVRRLVEALHDPDPDVRMNLAVALARIGTPSVEPLTAALTNEVPERRAGAAYALGLIGPAGRSALPTLLDALDDKDVEVRRQAAYAVSRMVPVGPPPPPPAVRPQGFPPPPPATGGR